ncbi:hypothetical protein BDV59DRAFT_152616 [Aspergillus ambiguus]|uniref:uncharacterized protein n=1 Tax=Aspergillus ambiguus TaxID=176160 RepID=UPI003CCD434F
MKRKDRGGPKVLVQRWSRPPLSCASCRSRKIRCDRTQLCSNCRQRGLACVYPEGRHPPLQATGCSRDLGLSQRAGVQIAQSVFEAGTFSQSQPPDVPAASPNIYDRVRRLEEIILRSDYRSSDDIQDHVWIDGHDSQLGTQRPCMPFIHESPGKIQVPPNLNWIMACLPPRKQAQDMFSLFVRCMQPTHGVVPVPYTEALMETIYRDRSGGEANLPGLALIFSIFAGAALSCTPESLDCLCATQEEMRTLFAGYSDLAFSLLEDAAKPCVLTLAAISTLTHVLSHTDGYSNKVHMLRVRLLLQAQTMQLHRLDTVKRREERKLRGYDVVELEISRRIWWHMVASDWLLALMGGSQEGVYLIQPKQMKVDYPKNIDDVYIATDETDSGLPLMMPTSVSALIYRIRFAEICREVVDTIPAVLLESSGQATEALDYEVILSLDMKFQLLIHALPSFFQLDPTSIQQSEGICRERPYIAWQRTMLHFSIHGRICRLHRLFHLEGIRNPKYAYSREICIRSAETVLNLRRSMEGIGALVGLQPKRFWLVMQHVFIAAIILAMDVSLNPHAPGADSRKGEVLAACQMLEKSKHESPPLKEAIQKNTHTLLGILHNQLSFSASHCAATTGPGLGRLGIHDSRPDVQLPRTMLERQVLSPGAPTQEVTMPIERGSSIDCSNIPTDAEPWGQLWSDVFDAGLEPDLSQWSLLFDDVGISGV